MPSYSKTWNRLLVIILWNYILLNNIHRQNILTFNKLIEEAMFVCSNRIILMLKKLLVSGISYMYFLGNFYNVLYIGTIFDSW